MRGFIALTTVLIILAAGLLVGAGISFLGIENARLVSEENQSSQAEYLANLCVEDALMKLKGNINYSGNETLTVEDGVCEILTISGAWTIETIGNFQNRIKKIRVVVEAVTPQVLISSWQYVP